MAKFDPSGMDIFSWYPVFTCCVIPRPIPLVSTVGKSGVCNLAPYGFFSPLCAEPPLIGFHVNHRFPDDGTKKHTLINIEDTKEFVVCVVTEDLAEKMNHCSHDYPTDRSEFEGAGLTPVAADFVKAPLVAESPINMECRLVQILEFGKGPVKPAFVIGEIQRVHVKDDVIENGEIQMSKLRPVGRLGGMLYTRCSRDMFEMESLMGQPPPELVEGAHRGQTA